MRSVGSRRSPICSSSTTARSRREPTTRSCGFSPSPDARGRPCCAARAVRAREPAAPRRHARAAARLRRRAEEHVLSGQGRACVGRPSHRRPRELRNAALVRRRNRALPTAVRRETADRRPRPAPRVSLDQICPRARGRRARGGPAPSCASRRVPCRARRGAASRSARSSTAPATEPTARCGEGSSSAETLAISAAWACWRRCALPGGARAIREPWRMACAWLGAAVGEEAEIPRNLRDLVDERRWHQVQTLIRSGVNAPVTTSMGRLFDAAAALCGMRPTVNYEGQAAIELEAACDSSERGCYPIDLLSDTHGLLLDPRETIRALVADVRAGTAVGVIASRFHAAIASGDRGGVRRRPPPHGTDLVVLSGGVFQNRRLLEAASAGLDGAGAAGPRRRSSFPSTMAVSLTVRPPWPRDGMRPGRCPRASPSRRSATFSSRRSSFGGERAVRRADGGGRACAGR